ncbi:MAG TPA: hypothetical protein VEG08_02555 [Terriglobales bacterium]|nr:hypothetical protein [Terriglobales bacterium]
MRLRVRILLSVLALGASLPASAQVLKGSKPAPEKPNPNRLLLPSSAFAGGILTGYVMGPDNQPVANAPVSVNGGELMGEVIGDPIKKKEEQRHEPPQSPSGGSFTDWQRTALDFCKAGPGANPGPHDGNPGPPDEPSFQWSGRAATGEDAASPQWGGFTNAAGGFLICVPPGAKDLQVSTGGSEGGGAVSVLVALDQPSVSQLPSDPPSFCSRGAQFDLNGTFPHATAEQDGQVSDMAVVMAIGPAGQAVSTVECSPGLHPGPVELSITDGSSHTREYHAHIFQFVDGALDREHLLGGQPADFWYEVQMGPEEAGKSLCVDVSVAGPVVLTKPPAPRVQLNGDGRGRISGNIQTTHVAPGSTVPFVIHAQFTECGK